MQHPYLVPEAVLEMALDEAGLSLHELRTDYSGRGMYGATCIGLVCSLGELLRFVGVLAVNSDVGMGGTDWDWVRDARSDGMGLSTIWYWPGVQVEELARPVTRGTHPVPRDPAQDDDG